MLVCPEAPYPVLGGGAQRIASLIDYFAARDFAVDVLTFVPCPSPAPAVRDVLCVPLPPNGRSLPTRIFRNAGRLLRGIPPLIDRLAGFDAPIRAALAGRHYDIAVLEHFWVAPYVNLIREFAPRVWCDLHNIESRFFQSMADASGPLASRAHRRFARLSRVLEADLLPRFDGVLVCSESDACLLGDIPSVVFPNTIAWREKPDVEKSDTIVFSGNMEYHPNQQAVRWFHAEIWPALRNRYPALRWKLVGMNPDSVRSIVTADPRIELTGAVEDAISHIAAAKLAVVPLLAGSGTRIKILEAWAAGTAVVSTSLGAEGLPPCLRLADNARDFERAVSESLTDLAERRRLELAGRKMFEDRFHRQAAWSALDSYFGDSTVI